MKYLIVSDIHGSLPALEQVLAFIGSNNAECFVFWEISWIMVPGTGYLKDLTRKGSQNVSMRWPVRLSPSVETVIRRWTRCCWTFPSCPITPCWWIMENVSFSPTDISTMRTDCRREGSIVFLWSHPPVETWTDWAYSGLQYRLHHFPEGREHANIRYLLWRYGIRSPAGRQQAQGTFSLMGNV